jgi:hypothetical protein
MRRRILVLAHLGFLIAGCGLWPSTFHVAFPASAEPGTVALAEEPVEVYDFSGTIAGVVVAATDGTGLGGEGRGRIDDETIILEWIGGACESRVRILVNTDDDGYRIRIHPEPSLLGLIGCPAIGIARAVRLQLHGSAHPERIVVTEVSY